jgi:hypothetical protein
LNSDGTPLDEDPEGEALLRRALLDAAASVSISLRVTPLPVSESVTVIFHGRRDLGTIQTYVAGGALGQGDRVAAENLLRVPCDLDLATATDREEAAHLYRTQATAMRDALLSADTVLAVWLEPLEDLAGGRVDVRRSVGLDIPLPAPRLMPTALLARERGLVVAPVCSARTLADGRPPLGIACAQPDIARIYPLPDDPERCLEDFLALAADHAHRLEEQIVHQEASIERFLELNGEE